MADRVEHPSEEYPSEEEAPAAFETPSSRSEEQELASGRTAFTPLAVLSGVTLTVGVVVTLVLALVVLALVLE